MDKIFLSKDKEEEDKNQNNKFKQYKDQTIKSLQEVEKFLRQTKKFLNHVKLYKILK